jgi:hypothetical protein
MPAFVGTVGIDYSGARTPNASLKGPRIYMAEGEAPPFEVLPPPSPRKYWMRRGIAEWLVERLAEDAPTLVGIDHGFSFRLRYFETYSLKPDWPSFLDDFQHYWPTDVNPHGAEVWRKRAGEREFLVSAHASQSGGLRAKARVYWGFCALVRRQRILDEDALAEGAGFEPAIRFPAYTLSRRAPSTTRPPLRCLHSRFRLNRRAPKPPWPRIEVQNEFRIT